MTLERRREGLVITSLPLQDMALLSLAVPLSPEGEAVLAALRPGGCMRNSPPWSAACGRWGLACSAGTRNERGPLECPSMKLSYI